MAAAPIIAARITRIRTLPLPYRSRKSMIFNSLNTGSLLHRPSRKIAVLGALVIAALPAAPVAAQSPAADSLAARLRRAEQAIAVLQQQIAEQSQGGARTRSGARIEFTGRVMVNGFG